MAGGGVRELLRPFGRLQSRVASLVTGHHCDVAQLSFSANNPDPFFAIFFDIATAIQLCIETPPIRTRTTDNAKAGVLLPAVLLPRPEGDSGCRCTACADPTSLPNFPVSKGTSAYGRGSRHNPLDLLALPHHGTANAILFISTTATTSDS